MYKGKLQYCIKKKCGNVHFTYDNPRKRVKDRGRGRTIQLRDRGGRGTARFTSEMHPNIQMNKSCKHLSFKYQWVIVSHSSQTERIRTKTLRVKGRRGPNRTWNRNWGKKQNKKNMSSLQGLHGTSHSSTVWDNVWGSKKKKKLLTCLAEDKHSKCLKK